MPLPRRALFAALPALMAGCAGRFAPPPGPDRVVAPPDAVFTMPDGACLPVRVWQPAGPVRAVVLALHGFNDSRDAWEDPAPCLAGAGIALYAPDQRGFGAAPGRGHWPGTEPLVRDAMAGLAILRARHPEAPIFLAGESMGGAVAMLVAARQPTAAHGYALLAPAVWARAEMNPAMTAGLWLAARLLPNLELTGRLLPHKLVASDNRAALLRLATDPLTLRSTDFRSLNGLTDLMDAAFAAGPAMPARSLFLYGAQDHLVPARATAALWRRLPDAARRAFYPDGYHLLLRDKARALPTTDLAAWMIDPPAPLPSAAEYAAAAWIATDPA